MTALPVEMENPGVDSEGVNPENLAIRTRNAKRQEDHAKRKGAVIDLRRSGHTFDEIAREVGISQQHASRLFKAALLDTYRRPAEEERELELLRNDGLIKRWWPDLLSRDGDIAERASNQLKWILSHRADLLGLKSLTLDVKGVVGGVTIPADADVWNALQQFRAAARAAETQVIEVTAIEGPAANGNGSHP